MVKNFNTTVIFIPLRAIIRIVMRIITIVILRKLYDDIYVYT